MPLRPKSDSPAVEFSKIKGKAGGWRLPAEFSLAGWSLVSLANLYSGYTKLITPSWVEGSGWLKTYSRFISLPWRAPASRSQTAPAILPAPAAP
jgi:hypothetical protein